MPKGKGKGTPKKRGRPPKNPPPSPPKKEKEPAKKLVKDEEIEQRVGRKMKPKKEKEPASSPSPSPPSSPSPTRPSSPSFSSSSSSDEGNKNYFSLNKNRMSESSLLFGSEYQKRVAPMMYDRGRTYELAESIEIEKQKAQDSIDMLTDPKGFWEKKKEAIEALEGKLERYVDEATESLRADPETKRLRAKQIADLAYEQARARIAFEMKVINAKYPTPGVSGFTRSENPALSTGNLSKAKGKK